MLKRFLIGVGALLFFAAALPTDSQAQMPQGKEVTLTGHVVDVSCKFQGQSGEAHKMCAEMCADAGVPLAILGSDGALYIPITKGMPGTNQNKRLKPFAEQKVTVKGTVLEMGYAKAIQIEEINKS